MTTDKAIDSASPSPAPLTYQVGIFALVRKQHEVLLVRPHQLLLPGGPQSLPGTLIEAEQSGLGVVETALRRLLLSQVGISVSEFWLVGSHTTRSDTGTPLPRLNLIFGTEYCSGIVAVQHKVFKSALWVPRIQLAQRVPEWLSAALTEMGKIPVPTEVEEESTASGGLFSRRR